MCGIAGVFGRHEESGLGAAMKAIEHRGPDDCGVFTDDRAGVALVHTRLAILELSQLGHQPMVSADGTLALVYNGEIYNFRELRASLEANGCVFRGQSDTEVLLNLYRAVGPDCLPSLRGIFAFAIWDTCRQELFVARDALGVKPLYYSATNGSFAFSSEIKALLALAPQSRELDPEAISRYMSFLWCPGEGTPLKAVRKVLPGEAMVVRAGRIERRWTWYQLPVFRTGKPSLDAGQAIKGAAEHLRRAVHRQMVSDVPVGAFLSGGLDSSATVAFAREETPAIRCFTIETTGGAEEGTADDLPYAHRVARHLGVSLEVVTVDSIRMARDLERMVVQLDEPLADPASLNVFYISQLARQHGIKVLLSGAGGDDLFTGYRRHHAARLEPYCAWLPRRLWQVLASASAGLDVRSPFQRRLSKLVNGAALQGDARVANYFRWISETNLQELYSPEFRHVLQNTVAEAPMLEFLSPLPPDTASLDRLLALEQRFFLADHNLIYTDKMSMAAGVEVRVPFLDLDLVEFAARVPARYKQRGSVGKWVLKKAMEPYLPRDVIYRPKSGFGVPLRRWMRHELRELTGDLLSTDSLNRRGLFSPRGVQRLIAENNAGKADASYTLFAMLCIEIWCRAYVDGIATGRAPVAS